MTWILGQYQSIIFIYNVWNERSHLTKEKRSPFFTTDKHGWKNRIAYIVIASFTVWWGRVYQDYLWVTELIG
ncbi:hypothetical protein [Microcoleus sp. CAWBG640]|uniref:hypothetical protein n=1 Tax=Microcoleus sp. CAWBG640 TaxID=2841653 RepID=UPI00312B4507